MSDSADEHLSYVCPHYGHSIVIEDKTTGMKTKQSHYAFGPKWGPHNEVRLEEASPVTRFTFPHLTHFPGLVVDLQISAGGIHHEDTR